MMCINVSIIVFAIRYTKSGPEIENVVTRESARVRSGFQGSTIIKYLKTGMLSDFALPSEQRQWIRQCRLTRLRQTYEEVHRQASGIREAAAVSWDLYRARKTGQVEKSGDMNQSFSKCRRMWSIDVGKAKKWVNWCEKGGEVTPIV
jgi:hypothetical protein